MNDTQLKAFVTIADCGSYTKAAEELFVSQPAVTYQIKSLEKEVGVKLVERVASGIRLTAAGTLALEKAKVILAAERSMRNDLSRHSRRKSLCVGFPRIATVATPEFNMHVIAVLREELRDVVVEPRVYESGREVEAVLSGDADLAITCLTGIEPRSAIDDELFFDSKVFLVVASSDDLATSPSAGARDIKERVIFADEESAAFFQPVFKSLGSGAGERLRVERTDNANMTAMLVQSGQGVSFSPFAFPQPGLVYVPFECRVRLPIGVIWSKTGACEGVGRAREIMKALYKRMPGM